MLAHQSGDPAGILPGIPAADISSKLNFGCQHGAGGEAAGCKGAVGHVLPGVHSEEARGDRASPLPVGGGAGLQRPVS